MQCSRADETNKNRFAQLELTIKEIIEMSDFQFKQQSERVEGLCTESLEIFATPKQKMKSRV